MRDFTPDGSKKVKWYVGTVEGDGSVKIFCGVDDANLEGERRLIVSHNANLVATAKPFKADSSGDMDAGRKRAMLGRAGPSPLFGAHHG
jgi:hypothetical protein